MSAPCISVQDLGKKYPLSRRQEHARYNTLRETLSNLFKLGQSSPARETLSSRSDEFWALRDVSFRAQQGDSLAIIGRNGAGKSTLLKLLSRIAEPTSGRITIQGRVGSLLEVGAGFHPELSGRENIYLNGAILGMSRREIRQKFDEIVAFAEVERFLDTAVKHYSTGMYVRLAFSVAAHLQPEILIVDEVLSVGDAAFQRKCMGKLEDTSGEGKIVLLVSHSMADVTRLCKRALLLDKGTVAQEGPADEVARQYLADAHELATSHWRPVPPLGDAGGVLHGARLHDLTGNSLATYSVEAPVYCTIDYELREQGRQAIPALQIVNDSGVVAFGSAGFELRQGAHVGRFSATCTIPANLLAEGFHAINVGLVSYNPQHLHAYVRDALGLLLTDPATGAGTRGDATGHWPGVVRPKLDWRLVS